MERALVPTFLLLISGCDPALQEIPPPSISQAIQQPFVWFDGPASTARECAPGLDLFDPAGVGPEDIAIVQTGATYAMIDDQKYVDISIGERGGGAGVLLLPDETQSPLLAQVLTGAYLIHTPTAQVVESDECGESPVVIGQVFELISFEFKDTEFACALTMDEVLEIDQLRLTEEQATALCETEERRMQRDAWRAAIE